MSDERRPPQGYGEQPELHGGDQWGEPGAMSPRSAKARYPAPQRPVDRPADQVEVEPRPARPPERPVARPPAGPAAEADTDRRSARSGRVSGGYVDRDYGPPIGAGRRGSPRLMLAFGVLALCLIGALLYFVALGNDLPGGLGSTTADGGDVEDAQPLSDDADVETDGSDAADGGEENPPVSSDGDTSDGSTDSGGDTTDAGDGGDADQPEVGESDEGDAADGQDSPETTLVDETGSESTIALGLSSDIDGVLDSDGIVLTGTAQNQAEVDRLVERLSVLSGSGTVDASAVVIDEASPPVRELALSVSDQIGFSVNSDVIEPDFAPILDRVVEFMQADQTISIAVLGHTDADGIDFENLALSQRRAEVVVDYLVEQGVNNFRLEPLGRGSTEPVATNDTAEGRALNRRIEFTILGLDI